jgi:hypothetical protein
MTEKVPLIGTRCTIRAVMTEKSLARCYAPFL